MELRNDTKIFVAVSYYQRSKTSAKNMCPKDETHEIEYAVTCFWEFLRYKS